jgi:cardiolipin synthase A/B
MSAFSQRLIVEPDDGLEPIRELIDPAQNSLFIKQFTFTEPSLVAAVIDRKNAGVDVRAMLNAKRSGVIGQMTRRTSNSRMPGSRFSGPVQQRAT